MESTVPHLAQKQSLRWKNVDVEDLLAQEREVLRSAHQPDQPVVRLIVIGEVYDAHRVEQIALVKPI